MKIEVKHNFPEVRKHIAAVGKQARFAAAVALTRTAQDVRAAERAEMPKVFDRPTRYTLNSLFLSPAKRDRLEAQVWLKDDRAGSGTPATRYLLPNIQGGPRGMKGFEVALRANGLLPDGHRAVPGAGVKLDSFGNVSAGLVKQVMSQLRVQLAGGFESRATGSKRSQRTVRKQGVAYFALQKQHGKLVPGIYSRRLNAPRVVKPIFIFVASTNYKPRFQFVKIAETVVARRFVGHFNAELVKALRTAR